LRFSLQVSTPLIKNVLLLDAEGKRVAVKYYSDDWPTLSAKLAFEKSVFTKTQRTTARSEGALVAILRRVVAPFLLVRSGPLTMRVVSKLVS
jgi:hypothetical protein